MTVRAEQPVDSAASKSEAERLPVSLHLGWGVGALGMAILLNAPAGLLAPFMTNFLGISAGTVATILFASKIYDMITDPLMGFVSDKTSSPWGRRRPYLFLGAIVSSFSFVLLFIPPQFDGQSLLVGYMLVALLISYTGYTLFNVPFLAMPAEMTQNYHERTIVMTYRIAFANAGMLISALGFALVQWFGNDRAAHAPVALMFAVLILVSGVACFFGTAPARQTKKTKHTYTVLEQFKSAIQNRPYRLLLGAKLCQLLGVSAAGTASVYFKVAVLGLDYEFVSSYVILITVFIFIFLPFWTRVAKIAGKRRAYMTAVAGYVLVTLTWYLAEPGDPIWSYYARGAALGVFGSGVLVMGPALLPDTIEYDFLRTGLRREGIFASLYTTMEKLAFSIGPAITLAILSWFNYQPSTEGLAIDQPESAIFAIYLCAAGIPAIAYGISLVFLAFYDLSEERLVNLRASTPTASTI